MIRRAVSRPAPAGRLSVSGYNRLLACLPPSLWLLTGLFNNRRQYFIARDYVENLLTRRAQRPLAHARLAGWSLPCLCAGDRQPPSRTLDCGYQSPASLVVFDYLSRAYPVWVERSRDKIEAFVENLKEWERDPGAFARSPALTQRNQRRIFRDDSIMVMNESRVAPVYMTNDLLSSDSVNG